VASSGCAPGALAIGSVDSALLQAASGIAFLVVGGELLVRGAVGLARTLGVSQLLIGATVVAFGTSAPELAVALRAAGSAHGSLAAGTILGSNVCNVLLILPVAALLGPLAWSRRGIGRDAGGLAVATALFTAFAASGRIDRAEGAGLLAVLGALTAIAYRRDRRTATSLDALAAEARALTRPRPPLPRAVVFAIAGLGGVVAGADLLVGGATTIARALGVSEAAIGLTLVAIGTSLPELAASAASAWRGHPEIALGNVIGSNVFNQLGIAGAAALVAPLQVGPELLRFDLWAVLVVLLATSAALVTFERLARAPAIAALSVYVVWVVLRA
jgi:cation:H+ antiporter